MSDLLERVAGAPITWGVCEVPGWGHRLAPGRVLEEMAALGLRATELGPEGYLPVEPERLRDLLASHGLRLAGGFVPAVLHEVDELPDQLARVTRSADLLTVAGADVLVLAVVTDDDGYQGARVLDPEEWRTLVGGIGRVMEIAEQRGLVVALHPHYGTVVEGPHQLRRLLESSPVPLCVDTGHLTIGGADPVEVTRAARGRVACVHLKDVAADVAEGLRTRAVSYHDAVRGGMYRSLGAGDVRVSEVVRELERSGYRGWYVLEQDAVLETTPEEGEGPVRDAAVSLEFLRRAVAEAGRRVAT